MTPERVRELLNHIPTLATVAEANGFRDAIRSEQMTSALYAALLARIELLNKRGAL